MSLTSIKCMLPCDGKYMMNTLKLPGSRGKQQRGKARGIARTLVYVGLLVLLAQSFAVRFTGAPIGRLRPPARQPRSYVPQETAPYLKSSRCRAQVDCPIGKFCALPPRSLAPGACEGCWQCCLFPNVFGTVTCSGCGCAASQPCLQDLDCGPGEFCAVQGSRSELPTCQSCVMCRNDSLAWSGSCASACPSAALQDNGVPEGAAAHYVFAAFATREHPQAGVGMAVSPVDGVVRVTEAAVRLWLGDLPPYVLSALLPTQLGPPSVAMVASPPPSRSGSSRVVLLGDFATRLAAVAPSLDPLCPQSSQAKALQQQQQQQVEVLQGATLDDEVARPGLQLAYSPPTNATTVPTGCPCSPVANATTFRCSAGQRCSPRAWLSLPADIVTLGSTGLLKARCVSCDPGAYCPEGTYVEEQDKVLAQLDCPVGQYCRSPGENQTCPAGFFCPARSTQPITCMYEQLLGNGTDISSPLFWGTAPSKEMVKRLLQDREPIRGNYCPNGSALPTQRCSATHYCPDPSLELICPAGHYCRAESIAPVACPPLTVCPAGRAAPLVWPAAVATFLGILLLMALWAVLLRCADRSKDHAETDQERRSRGERALRDLVAYLNRRPVTAACPELAAIQRYHVAVEGLTWRANGQPHGHLVLNGVSGRFLAGHLSAILGPSGCGKSSLLALLAGRVQRGSGSRGTVTLRNEGSNTQREIRDAREICYVAGFVPQDDIVCADLTIRENLEYSAALRLPMKIERKAAAKGDPSSPCAPGGPRDDRPAGLKAPTVGWDRLPRSLRAPMALSSPEERRKVVNEVLGMMALRTAQSYRVGSVEARIISGGQRKRVNIGVELVSRPPLLFLDEPTSGLDASCSNVVLRSLLGLAVNGGVNVVTVIHQPRHSVFHMFHEVHLLGEGGSTVYHGEPGKVREYFEGLMYFFPPNENVADTLLDIVTGKIVNKRCLTKDLPRRWRERISPAASGAGTGSGSGMLASPFLTVTPTLQLGTGTPTIGSPSRSLEIGVTNSGRASPGPLSGCPQSMPSPFANMSWCSSVYSPGTLPASSGSLLDAASGGGGGGGGASAAGSGSFAATIAAAAGGGHSGIAGFGSGVGGDIYRPEFTEDVKDILEAEFDMLIRAPKLLQIGSAARRTSLTNWATFSPTPPPPPVALSRSSTLRSSVHNFIFSRTTTGAPPDGLTLEQLRQLFIRLGQEDEDAKLLVAVVLRVHRTQHGSSSTTQLQYNENEPVVVSKALLIDTLLRVVQGDLRVPSAEELRAQVAAEEAEAKAAAQQASAEERRVLRRMASAASTSLEVLTTKFKRAASNIFHRNPLSTSPSLMGAPSFEYTSSLMTPALGGATGVPGGTALPYHLDPRASVGSSVMSIATGRSSITSLTERTRAALSNLPLFGRLIQLTPSPKLTPVNSTTPPGVGMIGLADAAAPRAAVAIYMGGQSQPGSAASTGPAGNGIGGSAGQLMLPSPQMGQRNLLSLLAHASADKLHRNRSGLSGFGRSAARFDVMATIGGDDSAPLPTVDRSNVPVGREVYGNPTGNRHTYTNGITNANDHGAIAVASTHVGRSNGGHHHRGGNSVAGSGVEWSGFGVMPSVFSIRRRTAGNLDDDSDSDSERGSERDDVYGGDDGGVDFSGGDGGAAAATEAGSLDAVDSLGILAKHGKGSGKDVAVGDEGGGEDPETDGEYEVGDTGTSNLDDDDRPPAASDDHGDGNNGGGGGSGGGARPALLGRSRRGRFNNAEVEAAITAAAYRFQLTKAHASSFRAGGFGGGVREIATTVGGTIQEEEEGGPRGDGSRCNSMHDKPDGGGAGDRGPGDGDGAAGGVTEAETAGGAGGYGGANQVAGPWLAPREDDSNAANRPGTYAAAPEAAWQHVFSRIRRGKFRVFRQSKAPSVPAPPPAPVPVVALTLDPMEDSPAPVSVSVAKFAARAPAGGHSITEPFASRLQMALSAASVISEVVVADEDASVADGGRLSASISYSDGIGLYPKLSEVRLATAEDGDVATGAAAARGGCGRDAVPGPMKSTSIADAIGTSVGGTGGGGGGDVSSHGSLQGGLWKRDSGRKERLVTAGTALYGNTGWLSHLWIFFRRACVQASRAFWPVTVLEVCLLLAAAAAVGANHGTQWGPTAVPGNATMAMMCLAVLAVVQHLRTFTTNSLVLRRERGAGLSPTAYFTARSLVDIPWILAAPAIFTLPYYVLTVPRAPFAAYYAISVGVWWWASGLSYLLSGSPLIPQAAAPTAAVLITLIAGALLNGAGSPSLATARGTWAEPLLGVSYNRWALEALTVAELDYYMDTHRNVVAIMYREKGICGLDLEFQGSLLDHDEDDSGDTAITLVRLSTDFTRGYCRDVWRDALIVLFCIGLALRLLAMLALKYESEILLFRDTVVLWWRKLTGRHPWRGAAGSDAEAAAEQTSNHAPKPVPSRTLNPATLTTPVLGRSAAGGYLTPAETRSADVGSILLQSEASGERTPLQTHGSAGSAASLQQYHHRQYLYQQLHQQQHHVPYPLGHLRQRAPVGLRSPGSLSPRGSMGITPGSAGLPMLPPLPPLPLSWSGQSLLSHRSTAPPPQTPLGTSGSMGRKGGSPTDSGPESAASKPGPSPGAAGAVAV